MKINEVVVDTKEVTLAGGASEEVTFTTSENTAGSYNVAINGLSKTFTVEAAGTGEAAPEHVKEFKWWIIGGTLAGAMVLALIISVLRKRAY